MLCKKKMLFGTRSEAIKTCPLVIREKLNAVVCVTGQYREMLD